MATNRGQVERIKTRLKQVGYVTRNQCLKNYISRLAAIIHILKEEGWQFKTEKVKGDYKYTVTKAGN